MDVALVALSLFWLSAAILVVGLFEQFRAGLRHHVAGPDVADERLPDAVVILSLRGSDESLNETLDGLATQNYPRYQIRVVVDHPTDPANRIVHEWHQRHPQAPIRVEYLGVPQPRCTLKASAIHQVLRSLDPPPGAVVLVDGDADPYPTWLRDAVQPLAEAGVGAVTGNRWYLPKRGTIASWCRFMFSAFSLPTMQREGYAWGGTLAIRGEIACSESFLKRLEECPTEEQACFDSMRDMELRLVHNARLVQWNPESIELQNVASFLFRQMMMGRFYYPAWTQLLCGALVTVAASLISLGMLAYAVADRNLSWALPALIGMSFCAAITAEVFLLHRNLQQCVFDRQGRRLPSLGAKDFLGITAALPLTLAAYCAAIVRVHFATDAVWRRIRYVFHDDGIELDEYRPYVAAGESPAPAYRNAMQPNFDKSIAAP